MHSPLDRLGGRPWRFDSLSNRRPYVRVTMQLRSLMLAVAELVEASKCPQLGVPNPPRIVRKVSIIIGTIAKETEIIFLCFVLCHFDGTQQPQARGLLSSI